MSSSSFDDPWLNISICVPCIEHVVIDEKNPKSEFGVTKPKLEPLSLEQEVLWELWDIYWQGFRSKSQFKMIHCNFRSRPENDAGLEREAKTSNERAERNKRVKKWGGDLGKVGSKKVVAHFTIFYYKKRKIPLFPNMIQRSPLKREREGGRERNLVGRKNVTREVMLYQSGENVSLIFFHSLLCSHLEILIVEQIHYMWWSLSLAHT